jgi:tetratricopeptide (TPR) repeat protein
MRLRPRLKILWFISALLLAGPAFAAEGVHLPLPTHTSASLSAPAASLLSSNLPSSDFTAIRQSVPRTSEESLIDPATRDDRISDLSRKSVSDLQTRLEAARKLRADKEYDRSERALVQLLEGKAPEEIKRPALLELAMVMQDKNDNQKAQDAFAEYVRRYPKDASVPEILLRQAYLYREMGIPVLALAKFYGVISACLNLQLDQMEYYKKLVLRAQAEIAETYYLQGKYTEAIDYFNRLLKLDNTALNKSDVIYKLVRCFAGLKKFEDTVAEARLYIEKYPDGADAPEARYLLADALKKLGRNPESLKEIMDLLELQHAKSAIDPGQWLYWQQRAGNNIANQLYREGDFISALQIYSKLAEMNKSPEWQMPVWYQIGLVYENLKQDQKASEFYDKIIGREKELKEVSPSLRQVIDMAAWRKHYLAWELNALLVNRDLQPAPEKSL